MSPSAPLLHLHNYDPDLLSTTDSINKGENHWTKPKHANSRNRNLHTHPMENWPHTLVFGTTMAAILTEGAYLYMLACVLISKESVDQWCVPSSSFLSEWPALLIRRLCWTA